MVRAKGTSKQMELRLPTWGGRRKRRRKRGRGENRKLRKVPHRRRRPLSPRHPVHATWRVLPPAEAARYADVPREPFSSAWHERGRDPPVVPARTWLLAVGWRIRAGEVLLSLAGTS